MAPVICKKVNFLKYPVDFGAKLRGKPLFGKNKTFRGLFFGILFGILISFFQYKLLDISFFKNISLLNYQFWPLIGLLLGAGAIFGDLVESFFKRQLNIQPGKPWIPFDQLDFIVFALLFSCILYVPSWEVWAILFVITPFVHLSTNYIGYLLKIKKNKW